MINPQDLSKEEDNLLLRLAKRADSSNKWWYFHSSTSNFRLLTCLICNEVKDGGELMVEHARQHLKDSNLLPFI